MADNKEEWGNVEVSPPENVEFELEEEAVTEEVAPDVEAKEEEEVAETPKEEPPSELDGIETRGAQKRIRQLIRQRKEREEQIQTLITQNEELVKTISKKDDELFNVNKLNLDASEKQLTDKAELAREVYLEAFEEGDKEKLLKAQEALNEAQADLKEINSAKVNYEDAPKKEEAQYQPPVPTQQVDNTKAEEWTERNEWFGKDSIRTAAALAVDAELKGEGYSPNDNEFYEEIDRRLQKAFPQNYSENKERVQEDTSTPAQVVAGTSRSSSASNKRVKLSKEDVRLAEKWGIPLEHYAAEKLKVSKADGEYTNVT